MRTLFVSAVPILLAAAGSQLAAQVTIKTVVRKVSSYAALNSQKDSKSLPANTDVSNGYFLGAQVQDPNNRFCFGSCYSAGRHLASPTRVELETYAASSPDIYLTCVPNAQSGANELLATFSSPVPTAGRLDIDITSSSQYSATATVGVDVGDDGKLELSTAGQSKVDVVLGPWGLPVALKSLCAASQLAQAKSLIKVSFVPNSGRFTVVGTSCGGATLQGSYTGSHLEFRIDTIPQGQYPVLVIGIKAQSVPIPPAGCLLHTDLLVSIGLPTNGNRARLDIPVAKPPTGRFRVQFFSVAGGAWRSSNALELALP